MQNKDLVSNAFNVATPLKMQQKLLTNMPNQSNQVRQYNRISMSQNKFGESSIPKNVLNAQSSVKLPRSKFVADKAIRRSDSAEPMQFNKILGKNNHVKSSYQMKQDHTVVQPQVVNIKKTENAHQTAFNFDNKVLPQVQQMMRQLQNNRLPSTKSTVDQKEQINFKINNISAESETKKVNENFMDNALRYSPEEIVASMKEFYDNIMMSKDSKMKDMRGKIIAAFVALQTAPMMAYAADTDPTALANITGQVTYTKFLTAVNEHVIERVRVAADGRNAEFLSQNGERGTVNLFNDPLLFKTLQDAGVDLSVMPVDNTGNTLFGVLNTIAFPLVFFGGIFLINRSRNNANGGGGMDPNNPMAMGKSKARVEMNPDTGVSFDDVAGVDEAKEELTEIVDFLKSPERYTTLGAKIPRGALLIGPPGTGKTLLAKAVAGEAGVPFFSISAAEFIEMFVGVGASRVRDLFDQAKKNAPCIVFIDELDAVGRQRAQGVGMGNDEREQTINQILTEMDGFEGNKGVIVLAATNIPEVLDQALLRPGRFDRKINVTLPDSKGRTRILNVHAKDKALSKDVRLDEVAKRCMGMSGADLANVMNESAIFSARKGKEIIEETDIYDAIDRIQIGLEKQGADFSDERQKLVSYHEAGHALLGALMEEYDLVNKITIVPRGGAGGVTIFTPNEEAMESGMYSKEYLENRICVALGGRIAEEIINGKDKVTTGASNDFQQCTGTAKMMVEQMGMSDVIGPRNIQTQQSMFAAPDGGLTIKNKADAEVDRILAEQYARGMKLLTDNKDLLDAIAKTLIEKEKISGTDMLKLIQSMKPDLVSQDTLAKVAEVIAPVTQALSPPDQKLDPAPAQFTDNVQL